MDKRILFSLFVLVGNIAVAFSINNYLGVAHVAEYVALFTSVSTAIYAILAQPKERTEPILRIIPTLERHGQVIEDGIAMGFKRASLNVRVRNIGYSIAKDIKIECKLIPFAGIHIWNSPFEISLLSPRDSQIKYQIVNEASLEKLLLLELSIEVSYSNEDDKKQKLIKKVNWVRELQREA